MKYQAPYGSSDPDADYVDRNSSTATSGSKIPAGFPNWTQREIVDVIEKAGIVPDDELQLASAIQSGKMNYAVAGGTANALTAVLSPAVTAHIDGFAAILRITSTNTSPTVTLDIGAGAVPVKRGDGQALVKGDLPSGGLVTFRYSASAGSWLVASTPSSSKGWRFAGSTQSLPDGVQTVVGSWNLTAENFMGANSAVNAATGVITIGSGDEGVYVLSAAGAVQAATCTGEVIILEVNGVAVGLDKVQVSSGTDLDRSTTAIVRLAVGDTVRMKYQQSGGGASNMINWSAAFFAGVRVGG